MTAILMPNGKMRFVDATGLPLIGGKVYTYAAGTVVPKATYSDQAATVPNTNPVILDVKGEALIRWDGAYKYVLNTSTGVLVDTIDDFTPATLLMGGSTGSGLIGFLYAAVYSAGTVGKWLQDLATSAGSGFIGFLQSAAGAVLRTISDKLFDEKSLFDFMTQAQISDVRAGTLALDVSAAVQAAISYASPRGITLRAPAGSYKFTSALTKAQSFQGVSIRGDGYNGTVFDYSALPANASFLTINGGSGGLVGDVISGIKFVGHATTAAIEINGQGGQQVLRCQFHTNLRGLLLHNSSAGNFTEFCTADDCDFTSACITPLEYRRTAGNASFHGSGLRGCCTVNGHASGTPTILVGAGCLPYNAPLSLQLWPAVAQVLIQNNNLAASLNNCNWHGEITLESVGASIVTLAAGAVGTRTLFSGSLSTISEFWRIGSLRLCENLSVQSSGAISALLKPYTVVASGIVTGGTVDCLFDLVTSAGIASGSLVHITLIGANYRYSYLAIVTLANGAGGANAITTLATTIAFNASGWGAATFSIDVNNKLVVTNASGGFSVTADVAVSPIGYYML